MANRIIPFNKPFIDDRLRPYLDRALAGGKLSGDGAICKNVESTIRTRFSIPNVLLVSSCTHALEMAMMLLDLKPGDEVITPSFTFVSTANAILHGGAVPVFCEINPRTLTMDPADLEAKITPRTRAVIPVHYAGVAADMDPILEVAARYRLPVVEDAAQGVDATYKGRYLGSIADMGAYSFHDTKNIVSGEGGAFLTNNSMYARRAEIIREKGTNRSNFLRGEVDKYTWVDHGGSYILSELLAAVLQYQFDIIDEIQSKRTNIYHRYHIGLTDLAKRERLSLPYIPDYCKSNAHIFHILLNSGAERNRVMQGLKEAGISATFHYIPLHSAPFGRSLSATKQTLPVTDRISDTLLRLPLYPGLTDADVDYVIETLHHLLA